MKIAPQKRLELLMQSHGIVGFKKEVRFHPKRQWRFDLAREDIKLAIEVEGGIWMNKSRHTSGVGYEKDCEKYNAAIALGWCVARFTGGMIDSGKAIDTITLMIALLEKKKV